MARLLRIQFEGAIYHVTFRGNERRNIFRDDRDSKAFLSRLGDRVDRYGVRVYLICLMTNHVHLLVETPKGNLSEFMRSVLTAYAVYFNRRHRRAGHLTQGRYKAQVVEEGEYLLKLSRYIHLNPAFTRRGKAMPVKERRTLVRNYPWSTYRSYVGAEDRWDFVEYDAILESLPDPGIDRRGIYQRYVEEGLAQTDEELLVLKERSPLAIGSGTFVGRAIHRQAERAKGRRRDDVWLGRQDAKVNSALILESVADIMGVTLDELTRRTRGQAAKSAAAWALHVHAGLTQRKVAGVLGLSTGAAAAYRIRQWQSLASGGAHSRHAKQMNARLQKLAIYSF